MLRTPVVRRFPRAGLRSAQKVALPMVLALALVACSSSGDSDDPAGDGDPTAGATGAPQAGQVLQQTWPLTGLPVKGNASAAKRHPVIVLKMDNTYASAPQLGLGSADLVVEELVEGGLTRLAAFFYTRIPGVVGPVRSMRASDIGIVSPVQATVVTSGAASVTINRIRGAGIRYFNEGSKGFFRDDTRSAPYNLFTNLRETATLTQGAEARPDDYLPFGARADLPKGKPGGTGLVARFGAGHSTEWGFSGGHYSVLNSYAADDDQFSADSVLVLRVEVGDAGYLDPAGNPVPETKLNGGGPAQLFTGGKMIRAHWTKDGITAPISLSHRGRPLVVPAGHTWIELVPAATGEVTVTR